MQKLDPKAVWLFFISQIIGVVVSVLMLTIFVGPLLFSITGSISIGVTVSILFLLALPIIAWIWAKLTYNFYKYELREDGFRKEHGIIWKKYVTIPYDRIQNVDIYRGLIARLLGLSDLQIQTAGGITAGSYGAFSEGRLPGLSFEVAEQVRDELIKRARQYKNQGL